MRFKELVKINPDLCEYCKEAPEEVEGQFRLKMFTPYQIISLKDSPLEEVGILLEGSFRVINEFENGNVFMIEMNDAVSFVGEVTLLAGKETVSVTIEAVTPCTVAYLPVDLFECWLEKDAHFLRKISEKVARKLYCSSYSRGERLFYSAKYVLLKYFLEQCGKTDQFILSKTRQQMSEEIGMTVKTINRILSQFKEENLLSVAKGKVSISAEQMKRAKKALSVLMMENKNGTRSL